MIELLSIECRKYLAFTSVCITTISDWPKKLAPLSQPSRSKTKTIHDSLARLFRAWLSYMYLLRVFIGLLDILCCF